MSNFKKERDKDILDFHFLCKDLLNFINRRIIKKYIFPEISCIKRELSFFEERADNWKYFRSDDQNVTENEKLCNLFKDNNFLRQVQKFYESLENIINILILNEKNFEMSKKEIEIGDKKINLLFEMNCQLNKFFKSASDNSLNQKYKINVNNNQNITCHLSKVKLSNVLNDLKIINVIKDANNLEECSNNNNSFGISEDYDNRITLDNNNSNFKIKKENIKKEENIINNEKEDEIELENQMPVKEDNINTFFNSYNKNEPSNSSFKDFKLLSKKKNRDGEMKKNNEKYLDIHDNKLIDLLDNDNNQINKSEDKHNQNEDNSYNEIIEISEDQSEDKENNEDIDSNNSIGFDLENNNSNNVAKNESMIKYNNNLNLDFEKELKNQFSCIFSNPKSLKLNSDIYYEINNILEKISEIKFPKNKNKFENPYVIGTFKHFNTMLLLDSLPDIDILLKYQDIDAEEINEISKEIIENNLGLNYVEINKEYENKIAKVRNKCKIKIKDNDFFIYITLFFVRVNISSYIKKEKCINKYIFFNNNMYHNRNKILICLFFRRWRRKFKLFFIMPELLDIIIDFYYKENIKISYIIEHIFRELLNGDINLLLKKDKMIKDEKTMKEIISFIKEWYTISGYNVKLNNAIISVSDFLSKNDYHSLLKID